MPTHLMPLVLAALVPLVILVVFLAVRGLVRTDGAATPPSAGSSDAVPPAPAGITARPATAAWVPELAPAPTRRTTPAPEPTPVPEPAPEVAPAPPPAAAGSSMTARPPASAPRADHRPDAQLARRYTRPAEVAWKGWWRSWLDRVTGAPLDGPTLDAMVVSYLDLARPIVTEMLPSPDAPDPAEAERALRQIYLHPDRYLFIEGRWFLSDAVATAVGVGTDPNAERWQMAPADPSGTGDPDGVEHRLVKPSPRPAINDVPREFEPEHIVQALAIEGLVETTGSRRSTAARTILAWTSDEEPAPDDIRDQVAQVHAVCARLDLLPAGSDR